MADDRKIAYFSMEMGLDPRIPTYSGGLGILAADTIRSSSDMKVPTVGVTLLARRGYFFQRLDYDGRQSEQPESWNVSNFMQPLNNRITVVLEGRNVQVQAWKYRVPGITGYEVPVFFLDTDLQENSLYDRQLCHYLYGGDQRYRLCQEVILGIGGVRMLRSLGYNNISRFHMNEGHAALLAFELLAEEVEKTGSDSISADHIEAVRAKCVFTTHTPVPAGQDQFPMDLVRQVLGKRKVLEMENEICCDPNVLNMTYLGLHLSHYINGVSREHGRVSRQMFGSYVIDSITNGVHAATWVSKPFVDVLDKHIPSWRENNFSLRYALNLPEDDIWNAHIEAKRRLFEYIKRQTNTEMDLDIFTIGFARRAAAYKRADLLFYDIERLKKMASKAGRFQLVFAGKAHPKDNDGKEIIRKIFRAKQLLQPDIKLVYLPNYNIEAAKILIPGVDLWLNTPQPPHEASGTSGMKAALNAVPSLSVLDGWWIEGCVEGLTGWAITDPDSAKALERFSEEKNSQNSAKDAQALYDKLENIILPMFYNEKKAYLGIMKSALALNGSFFNTQRMLEEYILKAYFL
jgi:starch phosphorylase